jgi:CheY-like chemotaxis protein
VKAAERPDLLPELASEHYLCLTVADTGRGIDPTTREHVFEPFFTTKERGRGTGLGLPVVYGLMQAHHGYVEVKSELGIGTTVSLYFPVPKTAPVAASPVEETDATAAGVETILVVEDETDVRFFLEMVLRAHNYRVLPAATVDEALALFEKHKDEINLVFTDVGLPKIDGISLAQKLRAIKPSLPVVLASGYPTKEFKERLNELGPQAFLSKPYNTQELLQTIRRGLSGGPALQLTA